MGARNVWRLLQEALLAPEKADLASGESLVIKPTVDDQGSLEVGDGTTDLDVKVFLGATTAYLEANVGDGQVNIEGAELHFGDDDAIELGDGNDVVLKWNASYLEGGSGIQGTDFTAKLPSKADGNDNVKTVRVWEDFLGSVVPIPTVESTGGLLAVHDGTTGTNAFRTDVAGGVLNVVTAGANDDYHAVRSGAVFDFLNVKEAWFRMRWRLAEGNTDDATVWFGITSDLTTGGMQTGATGPLGTYDGAMIWKVEDDMNVQSESSNAGTQDTNADIALAVTGTWYEWAIHVDNTATTAIVTFYIDGVKTGAVSNLTRTGLVPGYLIAGVKAAAGAETLQIDYIEGIQLR